MTVSDDKKPMTGVWYRSTIDCFTQAKVLRIEGNLVEIVMTGGQIDTPTLNEFADMWELV